MKKGNLKECFIICPIGEEGSKVRDRSDKVLKHILRPPLEECGYFPIRADSIEMSGLITSQVINSILDAPLVIADLTGGNPNVFYELAIRHLIRKPYIHIIQKGETVPFDIQGVRTVEIDHTDLDLVEVTREQIKNIVSNLEKETEIDSPISISIDLASLKLDSKITEDLLMEMKELRNQLQETEYGLVRYLEPIVYKALQGD